MKVDKEKFIEVVNQSQSMGHLLELLGVVKAGGNYYTMKRRIMMWNIDVSHWEKTRRKRQGYMNDKINNTKKTPLSSILVKNSTWGGGSNRLKNRLIAENIFERKCYDCGGIEWKGRLMPVELEHKNGDKFDCRIDNLTLMCPNCHTFTPTYRRKKSSLKLVALDGFEPTKDSAS